MGLRELERVIERIENRNSCGHCPLRVSKPLVFVPDRDVRIAVVTEGPNREEEPELIASLVDHPMYTFLSALFGCKFRPIENATSYWTHLRKCFEASKNGERFVDDKATTRAARICSEAYLLMS